MNDPYKTLGIPRKAPQDAVKQAYRRLAMELHPDRNPENPRIAEKFKDVSAAYAIIGDAEKRGRFDRGEIDAWGRRRPRRPTPQPSASAEPTDPPDARKSKDGPAPGTNRQKESSTAEKATRNDQPKTASANPNAQAAPPPRADKKPRTAGKPGWLTGGIKAEDIFGPLFPTKAARAQPTAATAPEPTHRLRVSFIEAATGTAKRLTAGRGRALEVAVPPGIRDGQIIRLKGQGETGALGRRGDALVKIDVTPHKLFRAEGDDVHLEVPISLEEAVLGARIRVPTVTGSVEVAVPRGANSGAQLRLRGKGLRRPGGKTSGDQVIRLVITLPQGTDPDLEAFVRQRQGRSTFDPRENIAAA